MSGKKRGKLGGIIVCQTAKNRNRDVAAIIFDQMVKNSNFKSRKSMIKIKNGFYEAL